MRQHIKRREIAFCTLHADPDQAHSAVFTINDIHGVLLAHALDNKRIHVTYDLDVITLEEIESVLGNTGYHLDNSLISKLRRSIAYYCEEAHRENTKKQRLLEQVSAEHSSNPDVIFLRPNKHKPCECRDQRPEHWRKYL